MKVQFVDLNRQYQHMRAEIDGAISQVLAHSQFILGKEVGLLEQELAAFCGAKHCIAVANGTDALVIALMALDIQPGDEIITPAFSFFATAEAIGLLKAKPVFVDINPKTYNIDPSQITAKINAKTKAILAVSLYGQCADYHTINKIAQQHNLPVIDDAAQSFGATSHGQHAGTLATITSTSFFPAKALGCYGDGGACFTNDSALAEKIRRLHNHGQSKRYVHQHLGLNSRLDTLQAAILRVKLKYFAEEIQKRNQHAETYNHLLKNSVKTPFIESHNLSVYAQYTIECEQRDALMAELTKQGIPSTVHYPIPLHLQQAFAYLNYKAGDFPHAEYAANHVLSLPMHAYLLDQEIQTVAQAVSQFSNCTV